MKRLHYGWVMVIAAVGILTVHALTFYSFSIFLRPVTQAFHWDRGAFSGALSLSWLVSSPLSIIAGRFSDKYGPRLLLTACGLLVGLGFVLLAFVTDLWQVYLVYAVPIALGSSVCIVPVTSTIARWFHRKRGVALGLTWTGIGLGGVIAPLLSQWLINTFDWRSAYAGLGILNLVLLIPLAQVMRRSPEEKGTRPYGDDGVPSGAATPLVTEGVNFRQAFRSTDFWLVGSMLFCFFFVADLLMSHLAPHAADIGIPETIAASIVSLYAATSLIGRNLCGVISDRIGSRRTAVIAFSLVAVTLVWLLFTREPWMFYLFAVLYGVFFGIAVPLQTILPGEMFGIKHLGAISASLMFLGTIGSAVGITLGGAIYDATGSYRNAFVISAGLGIVSVVLSLVLLRMRRARFAQ